jgi:uncharacterized protein (TIGR02246 family)
MVVAIATLLVACSKAPVHDAAADEAAIRAVLGEIASTFNAGDYDGMFDRYLDDVIVSAPGTPDTVGKQAWRTTMASTLPPTFAMKLKFDTQEIAVDGDLAYERGTYSLDIADKSSGAPVANVGGRHIHIFKRQADGQWKGWRLMENSPDPAPPAPPAPPPTG